jgi:hypothetical protein
MPAAPRLLDASAKQPVQYCIPTWLRDEQVRQNTARPVARVQPCARREEPIAVVCFGPSLLDTWKRVKDFPFVISCSGAHKFLVERGIVPTWHVEVDPRAHKVGLIGPPQAATEYLLASACHREVFEHLADCTVKLWHVFDPSDDAFRRLPPGDLAVTGGCDVGLRAITMAAVLGFRTLHVFGMDQSAGTVDAPRGMRHAGEHPHSGKKFDLTEFDGVRYYTTPAMLEAARQVGHELDQMPAVHATFYGDGLAQHMVRKRRPKPVSAHRPVLDVIAMDKPALISSAYAALNAQLHEDNLAFGVGGGKHAETVTELREEIAATSVLDYGCGKGYLAKALPFPIWEYDPAIPEKSASPRPADLVVCTDVLEHVEPDRLPYVLADLQRCIRKLGFFVIHTGPAQKTLPDGRNTHLIQQGRKWWVRKLERFFTVRKDAVLEQGPQLFIVVAPK